MSHPHNLRPPAWPLKLLRLFIRREYLEEIEGDMEELFYDNLEAHSVQKARKIYAWEMLMLLRPALMKNLEFMTRINHAAMFKNYFKVSFRGLLRTPVNSFINVFGLAAAIGFCIFGYAFARWTFSTDQFHEHKHSVYLTTFTADRDGKIQTYGTTPRPIGELLRKDFAHVTNVCRVQDQNAVMKYEDKVFHERIRFVDPEFLVMFTFPLKWGATSALIDLNSIIISEKMSIKYFGAENPIGKTVVMIFDEGRTKAFSVAGVAQDFPKARSFSFDFLVNFGNLRVYDPAHDFDEWNSFVSATFIQVDDPVQIRTIERGMKKYRKLQNQSARPEWSIQSFGFEPLATLHKRTEEIRDDIVRSSHDNYISVLFMGVISLFLLALACFNYINIAIASAAKRLKEIGIRKSIGATRGVVVVQFLTENMVITSFALLVGLGLGLTFFIPGFELLWQFSMDFRINDGALWIFLPLLLLFVSIASGIYPSLYIAKFQVVNILKGTVKFGQRNPVTKVFLGFQLILCCVFITCSVLFNQNTNYLTKRSWGYNQRQVMYATIPDRSAYEKLAASMAETPNVQLISGSTHHIGKRHAQTVVHLPERAIEVDQLAVDAKYFETMGLQIVEGRGFEDHDGSDRNAVIVNENFTRSVGESGWEHSVGRTFRIDSIEYQVVGVVRDFHNYSFAHLVKPIIFTVAREEDFRFLTVKAAEGSEIQTFKMLQSNWARLFPETPFAGSMQQDVWGFYYEEIAIYDMVWKVLAAIAITLATLGLYGLLRLNVAGRTKEFSIRKVLGAGVRNITSAILSQYTLLFSAALAIGAPAGFFLGKWLIEFAYVYHMPITISGVTISLIIMMAVIVLTVATQIRKVMRANPVNGLNTE